MRIIGEYLKDMKRLSGRGRCLHYAAGTRCSNFIDAHSIQKSGQLFKIAERGHVIQLSADISILKQSGGRLAGKTIGVKDVSTFAGFCEIHDNELFEPIDNTSLIPTELQILLYAYRCLCKEYFVKENAAELMKKYSVHAENTKEQERIFKEMSRGTTLGFDNLKHHKSYFDNCLSEKSYQDIFYVCFLSNDPWNIQVSGVLYPWYDFLGNELQDTSDFEYVPELLTVFTAPTSQGWAYVLAWHVSSDKVCSQLVGSLTAWISNGYSLPDALLRFTFSSFENHAIRPSWWNKLNGDDREAIIDRATLMVAPNIPVPPDYLVYGLEGIANWKYKDVLYKQNK